MNIDEAVLLTQQKLAQEGGSMGDLLSNFRQWISPQLIDKDQWERVLDCASGLPISMAALPFGFELPLHDSRPIADFGASLASNTQTSIDLRSDTQTGDGRENIVPILRLFDQMEASNPSLRDIIGRKLMLEYDIGSANSHEQIALKPGMFVRPSETPIIGGSDQDEAVDLVAKSLLGALGWPVSDGLRNHLQSIYRAQSSEVRMDSIGVFPSRSRNIRLAIIGLDNERGIGSFLRQIHWPGNVDAVNLIKQQILDQVETATTGVNLDVGDTGVGSTLGLTLSIKKRYTHAPNYWIDGSDEWDPFLSALEKESLVKIEKLPLLAKWVTKPMPLFGKSGQFLLMRGIHHIKLVIEGDKLTRIKAYVFMVLSGAATP